MIEEPRPTRRASARNTETGGSGAASLSGTNLEHAGDYNQRVVLQAIRLSSAATRAELSRTTGLTAPAVANIAKRLIQQGLVEEAGKLHGGRGQPATKLIIAPNACFALGVNIDRDHVTVLVLDLRGTVRARASLEGALGPPAATADLVRRLTAEAIGEAQIDIDRLIGVGVALPDAMAQTELPAQHPLSEWAGLDAATLLADILADSIAGGVPIYVENDAAAAALGELQFGHGLRYTSYFYVLVTAGLGGGLVVEGDYFRGAHGHSGEIGFLPIHSERTEARSLQQAVSLSALVATLSAAGVTIHAPSDLDRLDADGQALVAGWLEMAADLLTEPLLIISWLINPAAVLIGGRLPASLVEALAEKLTEKLLKRGGLSPVLPDIRRAAMAEDAPAIGAALLPFLANLLPSRANLFKIGE